MQTIKINGIEYEPIEQPKTRTHGKPYMMALYAQLLIANSMMSSYGNQSLKEPPPQVNLVEEFDLIQQKKSKLSRANREHVVKQFHKRFKLVDNENI